MMRQYNTVFSIYKSIFVKKSNVFACAVRGVFYFLKTALSRN